jgi:kynurenine formamidase
MPYNKMEKLHTLTSLPSTGFTVAGLPAKIGRASADHARAVALITQ